MFECNYLKNKMDGYWVSVRDSMLKQIWCEIPIGIKHISLVMTNLQYIQQYTTETDYKVHQNLGENDIHIDYIIQEMLHWLTKLGQESAYMSKKELEGHFRRETIFFLNMSKEDHRLFPMLKQDGIWKGTFHFFPVIRIYGIHRQRAD